MLRSRTRAPNPTKTVQYSGGARGAASGSCARIFCIHCFISFLVLLIAAVGFLVIRMGFGAPFELNDAYVDATPLLPESALKVFVVSRVLTCVFSYVFFSFLSIHETCLISLPDLEGGTP
jgi:hypothetical protein